LATQPSRRSAAATSLCHFLVFPALCLAAGTMACSSLPPPRSVPPQAPQQQQPANPALLAGSQGELRLTLDAGRYVRLTITPAPVDVVVRHLGPDGSVVEELQIPGGGDEAQRLSWVSATAGEYRWIVAPRNPSGFPGSSAIAVEEERPAGPCDAARLRAERAVLGAQWELREPGQEAPAGARARALLEPVLASATEVGEREGVLAVLVEMARAARNMGSGDAAGLVDQALEMAHTLGDSRAEAKALEERAQLLPAAQAVATFLAALELRQRLGSEIGQATVLYQRGTFYYYLLRDNELALQSYRQALQIQCRNGDLRAQSWTLGELGVLYGNQGNAGRAQDYLDLALERGNEAGDFNAEASAFEGSARFEIDLGNLQAAYDKYSQASRLVTPAGVTSQAAWALDGSARVLLYLGEPERARQIYVEALRDFDMLHLSEGRAEAQLGIGSAFEQEGEPHGALDAFKKALDIIRANGLQRMEGLALYDLGRAHRQLRQPTLAIPELERALALEAADSSVRQAQTHVELAKAYMQAGKTTAAESAFRHAIHLSSRAPVVEAAAQAGLAQIERDRGELAVARSAIGRVLEITERLRAGVLRPDQRVSFLASRRAYYEFLVDLLMRLDRLEPGAAHGVEAAGASEQARARGLLDLLARERVDVRRGVPAELKRREEEIAAHIARLQTRLLSSASLALPEAEVRRLDRELAKAEEEEKDLDAEIRGRQPAYAAVHSPQPLPLQEMQALLDERTALLEFFLGEESSYLFVVTSHALATYTLPPRLEIARLVDRVNSALNGDSRLRSGHFAEDAYKLYQVLLLPAARELRSHRHLIVAPDGLLYSLSFEVLLTGPDAGRPRRDLPYLIREHSVSYVPSASVLAQLPTERQPHVDKQGGSKLFVGFGDPGKESSPDRAAGAAPRAGGGCDMKRGGDGEEIAAGQARAVMAELRPLPAARDEVCRIARLFPQEQVAVFTGPDATEETVKTNAWVASARNLHFASHGLLDENHPELSGLRLTHGDGSEEDGLLQVREIFNLELHADLVVLSACNTGLGKVVSGEGLIGMTRAFFYAGAGSVVVSLWQVDDESTSDLMVSFYRHLQEVGDKSEALRRAKLELIDGSRFFHPYFWAPFILVGRTR
jgi:CHAT domain-containing protein/Tfp pilus assembly protein PilF